MEFDEIVVKESPGLCRCCLSEGCYKDLGTEYTWMNDNEVYADMLLECFDISITQHNDGPNGPNRLICEVCITRLRDACNFKKQVLESEKKFIDMVGRGDFRPKVLIYQAHMKSEDIVEEPAEEVEYLEDDSDFRDDEPLKQEDPTESLVTEITAEPLPVKGKRGRPRKNAELKPEKRMKVAKMEDKAKTSKAVAKGLRLKREMHETYLERLSNLRRNILVVLRYGNVIPFNWNTRGYRCFFCSKLMKDCDSLKEHTILKHAEVDLEEFIPKRIISKDVPVKIDVAQLACKYCPETPLSTLEDLIGHLKKEHGEDFDSTEVFFFPFILNKELMRCVLCDSQYDNFSCMISHMYKEHINHSYICQICGLSFMNQVRLKRHISNSHVGHRCSICAKIFDATHKLDKHKQRIHGLLKTHECNLCSATFENQYKVKVHMGKIHNVEKYRIKCEYCPKICTTKGAMALHVQSLHSELRYGCDLCDYKTGIKWMIKLHKRKHFGDKDYFCSICDRSFGRSSNLRAHMKVHTGASGRVCRFCRKGFVNGECLKEHEYEFHYFDNYQ